MPSILHVNNIRRISLVIPRRQCLNQLNQPIQYWDFLGSRDLASFFILLVIMALETQIDSGVVLPPGWNESEQVMINNFFHKKVLQIAKNTCSASECHDFARSLMQGRTIGLVNNQGFHSLERELKTVTDLAVFIARSSFFPHPTADCQHDSKTQRAHATFKRLEQNSSLKAIAPDVHAEVTSVTAKLHLLESLPLVLSHPDLVGLNVFVDRTTGAITGVIDFDGAQIEALGINIVTLYEWFLGSIEKRHWSPYDMPAGEPYGSKTVCQVLESAFWETFWANVSPDPRKENSKEALCVALRVGIVNRYIVDSKMLDEVDFEKRHGDDRSLDYVKGILSYLECSEA